MRILVVEDQRDLNRIITKRLLAEGFSVDSCFDGDSVSDYIDTAIYDCVVMDIMMPGKDGLTVLREMRDAGNLTPVLFLTARDSIEDKVLGLDLGANDYLVKPFAFEELLARIRAVTRNVSNQGSSLFRVGDLVLDTSSHRVMRGGVEIALSAKEFALLEYLMRNQGRVLSRAQIENSLWNYDYMGGSNAVDVYIRYLRKKIDEGFDTKLIHTVRGTGYVLREEQGTI